MARSLHLDKRHCPLRCARHPASIQSIGGSQALLMREHGSAARRAHSGVMLLLVGLLGGLLLVGSADAANLYVSNSGADSAACGTQAMPCRNPDYAVNKALSGDTIVVAGGTYGFANVSNQCSAVPIRSVICLVNKAVTIRGGYASSTWDFDPVTHPTVIDGQSLYRGIFVYSSSSPGVRLTMANVTIQNARAKGPDDANATVFGAGINVDNAAVTLDSVTFLNNKAIGADTSSGQGGTAVGSGLSIRSTRGGAVSYLTNVRFEGNSSVAGRGPAQGGAAFGALFIYASAVAIENSTFVSNTASAGSTTATGLFNGERADALGGAIAIETGSVVSLARVTATGNQVFGGAGIQYGGGAFGGAVFAESSTLTIEDSVFQSNVTLAGSSVSGGYAAGGGILFFDSNGSITRARIIANRAKGGDSSAGFAGNAGGGGLNLWRNDLTLTLATIPVTNTVIADNIVELGNGGNPGGGGGGLQVQGLAADLDHVTFARNQLGAGLVVGQAMVVVPVGSGTIVNLNHSVVADHVASTSGATALVVTDGNTLNLNRGAFSGNTHDINNNDNPMLAGTITGLATMTTVASAGFVNASSYDYHITAGSALRGAATGSTMTVDIDSQPRVDGSRDIGADEYVSATCVPGGATDTDGDGMPDAVEQKEGTHPCARDNDVFGSVRLFLMQQYRDFLGREADPDGLLAWMATMGAGTNADVVAKAFFDSTEYQGTVAPIARLYFAYFNRVPDQQGLAYWIGQYRAGVSLAAISDAFASSSEFQSRYGSLTNAQFVTLVYQNVLGRDPDPDGFAYWVGQLNSGTTTRGKMMLKFSKSPEYIQRSYNWVFVTLIYYGMLRRVPDATGFQYWVAQLSSGASPLDLINSFLDTAEYRARFLS